MKKFLAFLALLWGAGASIILISTWTVAYANGGSLVISINSFAEQYPELLLLFVVAPIFAVGLYYAIESGEG